MDKNNQYNNLYWKFEAAVESLASSSSSLKDRLENVFVSHLVPLMSKEFPTNLGDQFEKLKGRVTSVQVPEGRLRATLAQISDSEAEEIAKEIFRIFLGLVQYRNK